MSAFRWALIAAFLCALGSARGADDLKINSGGKVIVRSRVKLNSGQAVVGDNGQLELAGGTVETSGVQVQANGLLTGTGTIVGDLMNDGIVALDNPTGVLLVTGSVLLNSGGTLKLSIGGLTVGGFSCLSANGTVTLGGTLALGFSNGFYEAILNADSFSLINSGSSFAGAFANVVDGARLTTVDALGSFHINYEASVLIVDSFIGPPPVTTLLYTSGDTISGESATTEFATFGVPSIDPAASTAFSARLRTESGSLPAVLVGAPVTVAYRRGDLALGADGPRFESFGAPMLSASGRLAFKATIKGAGVNATNDSGIWTTVSGAITPAVRTGGGAVGLVNAKIESVLAAGLFNTGAIPYVATLAGRGITQATSRGLWLWEPNETTLLLQQGTLVTFAGEPERKVTSFAALASVPRSPGHGRTNAGNAVLARVRFSDGLTAIAEISPSAKNLIVKSGDGAGNAPAGVTFASFGLPALNANGDIAFAAKLTRGSGDVSKANDRAIFADSATTDLALIARTDDLAPSAGSARFTSFADPVYNAEKNVAFIGTLDTRDTGIWRTEAGTLKLVARRGERAEGTPDGCKWNRFVSLALPDSSGPVFIAELRLGAGGVKRTNKTGLWAVDRLGVLHLIARTGDTVTVNNSSKNIASLTCLPAVLGTPDHARSYNNAAQLTYKATFTDHTQAIFRVDLP